MERLLALSAKVPTLLILTVSAIVATAGEYSAKRWSMQPSFTPFLLAIVLYAVTGTLFMLSLSGEKLLVAGIIFDILTQSSFLILGFVFHERLSKLQLVGAAFGVPPSSPSSSRIPRPVAREPARRAPRARSLGQGSGRLRQNRRHCGEGLAEGVFSLSASLPPVWAMSGRLPPLPPTLLARVPTSLPACSLPPVDSVLSRATTGRLCRR